MTRNRRKLSVRTLREFLALEHNILVLLGAILAIGMGEELWIRFIPKHLEVLGAGAVAIGVCGSFARIVSTIYQYPGGRLADRMGHCAASTSAESPLSIDSGSELTGIDSSHGPLMNNRTTSLTGRSDTALRARPYASACAR